MVDTTIFDKLKLIFNVFKIDLVITLIIILVLVMLLDLFYGRNKKGIKILYTITISLLLILIIINYYKPFINMFDVYVTSIFRIAYFPSIIEYVTMIIFTIIIQIISKLKCSMIMKNINIWIGIIIEILFIVNLIAMNNISVDLNNIVTVYENSTLLSIFQLSSIIFIFWIIYNIITLIIIRLIDNRIEIPKLKKEYYY